MKKVDNDEDFELEVRKDIFWKALFIFGFIAVYVIAVLQGRGWDTPFAVILVIVTVLILVIMSPSLFYDKVIRLYKAFYDKDKTNTEENKFVYNAVIYLPLAFVSYIIANAVNLFAFHKNKTTDIILIILFNAVALFLSIKITEKKRG